MASNLRLEDERLEKVLCEYLDRNLYTPQNNLYPFERNDDRQLQTKGLDINFQMGNTNISADEKMAVRYINKDINTFALELKTLNRRGNAMDGWLINDENMNSHYVLGWIVAKKEENIQLEDIIHVEVVIVDKQKLKNHISTYFDLSEIDKTYSSLEKGLSSSYFNDKYNLNMETSGFVLYYSYKLFERPFNILFSKEKYIELCDKHLIV